jgi:hypothetical protein
MFFDIETSGLDAGVPIEIGCPIFCELQPGSGRAAIFTPNGTRRYKFLKVAEGASLFRPTRMPGH